MDTCLSLSFPCHIFPPPFLPFTTTISSLLLPVCYNYITNQGIEIIDWFAHLLSHPNFPTASQDSCLLLSFSPPSSSLIGIPSSSWFLQELGAIFIFHHHPHPLLSFSVIWYSSLTDLKLKFFQTKHFLSARLQIFL